MHTAHNYIIEHLLSPAECKYIIDESEEFARQIQRNKHQRLLEKEKLPTGTHFIYIDSFPTIDMSFELCSCRWSYEAYD